MEKVKKVLSIILSIILWAVILLAAMYTFVTVAQKDDANVSSLFGVSPLSVQSDSMVPTFKTGDLIFIKKVNPDDLKVGDVVTFHTIIEGHYALNTHRITDISEENGVRVFVTKGDNNKFEDVDRIVDGSIVGKYFGQIKGFGKVMDFISSSVGFLVVILLPMLIFFIYQLYNLIMVSIKLKKAVAEENAAEAGTTEEAIKARDEAMAALEEAKRMKEEAEAALRAAKEVEAANAGATNPDNGESV